MYPQHVLSIHHTSSHPLTCSLVLLLDMQIVIDLMLSIQHTLHGAQRPAVRMETHRAMDMSAYMHPKKTDGMDGSRSVQPNAKSRGL